MDVQPDAAQEKLKTHADTCTSTGDQTVNGQAMSVNKVHNSEMATNQTVHILKSSRWVQGGTATKPDDSVTEARYEYDNVHAPAGVQ